VKAEAIDRLLREQEVLICCGSGGVGKTTTSAALAMRAALLGRKAVVCTIDPARRLANSLGLSALGNEVVQVDRERFTDVGLEPEGSLHAMMLDTKRTFDTLIARYAKSDEARERILANKFYQQMSTTVVGSSDYMAMEKLYELHEEGEFDLIVLDTPPTKHALDFLQAPQRMSSAFDESMLSVFLKEWTTVGKKSLGFLGGALSRLVKKVDDILGLQFVGDFADFFRAFEGMYEGFRGRAERVDGLLRESFTSFLVVTSPNPLALQEASFFCERLKEFEMPLGGVIVNRVRPSALAVPAPRDALHTRLAEGDPDALLAQSLPENAPVGLEGLLGALVNHELEASGDAKRVAGLGAGAAAGIPLVEVPHFDRDVYDLSGLKRITDVLFEEGAA
jgi:anion-transporting  ArsA/GET3 family ATPase